MVGASMFQPMFEVAVPGTTQFLSIMQTGLDFPLGPETKRAQARLRAPEAFLIV